VARRPAVRGAWDALTAPLAATVIHGAAIWAWHLPALYEASLASEGAHTLQHLTFLGTGLLFWWAFLRGGARRQRAAAGPAVLCLFFTTLHTGVLGAFLTFSRSLWYPSYGATTAPWGLMPLDDQQLAGLIMWIPGGIAYTIAGLAFLARLLGEERVPARVILSERPQGASRRIPVPTEESW
jgi:putative membrane protein